MLVKLNSISFYGMSILPVTVEISISNRGFPGFEIIGLASKEIHESKRRITTALKTIGLNIADKKIVVNLAPADMPKYGSFYDLPIATGLLLAATNSDVPETINQAIIFGELSLDGEVRSTKGSYLACLYAYENTIKNVFLAPDAYIKHLNLASVNVFEIGHLYRLRDWLQEGKAIPMLSLDSGHPDLPSKSMTESDEIVGQTLAKNALIISAAGGHNILLEGFPGSGKTLLAKTYKSLLPSMTHTELFETLKIYALKSLKDLSVDLTTERPYRAPHHTISYSGMMGGGNLPTPGEVTLAHNGVLFLDEFPEFSRQVIESLREPLEDYQVKIVRSAGSFVFPAKFTLLASCNPCPCGYHSHPKKVCKCPPSLIHKYKTKLSGPILDRIDLKVFVQSVDVKELHYKRAVYTHQPDPFANISSLQDKIAQVREIQKLRFTNTNITLNNQMSNSQIEEYCKLSKNADLYLNKIVLSLDISARSYFKLLKIARTIADLDAAEQVNDKHLAEAVQFNVYR